MTRRTRTMLMSGAAVAAALSLAVGAVLAEEEAIEDTDAMGSMEPMAEMAEMEPGLHIVDAWARESRMLDLAGAAYMVILTDTDADDALVGASSPAAEVVELHLSSMNEDGMMSMDQVMEIAVPAHGDAVLEPGSYHVMLIDLVEPLVADTEIELSLEFMTAEPQTITLPVKAGGPMMMDDTDMDGEGHDMDDMDAEGHEDMDMDMDHDMGEEEDED